MEGAGGRDMVCQGDESGLQVTVGDVKKGRKGMSEQISVGRSQH